MSKNNRKTIGVGFLSRHTSKLLFSVSKILPGLGRLPAILAAFGMAGTLAMAAQFCGMALGPDPAGGGSGSAIRALNLPPIVLLGAARDGSNNVYVLGTFTNAITLGNRTLVSQGGSDYVLAKYGPDGTAVWSVTFGTTHDESSYYTRLTLISNVLFVTGSEDGSLHGVDTSSSVFDTPYDPNNRAGVSDGFLLRFSDAGRLVWQATVTGSSAGDLGASVTLDDLGNTYWVGGFNGCCPTAGSASLNGGDGSVYRLTSPSYGTGFLAKLSPAGTPLWAVTAYNRDTDFSRVVAFGDFVCVLGNTRSWSAGTPTTVVSPNGATASVPNPGLVSHFLLAFSPAGDLFWSAPIYGTPSGNVDTDWAELTALALSDDYRLLVGGRYSASTLTLANSAGPATNVVSNSGGYDGLVAAYNLNGTVSWVTPVGGAGDQAVTALSPGTSHVRVGGTTAADLVLPGGDTTVRGSSDGFVLSLNSAGQSEYWTLVGGPNADTLVSVQAEGTEAVMAAGNQGGNFEGGGIQITNPGPYVLARYPGPSVPSLPPIVLLGAAKDGSSNVYVLGTFTNSVTVGGKTLVPRGGTEYLLAQYHADGSAGWAISFGTAGNEPSYSTTLTLASNALFVTGWTDGSMRIVDVMSNTVDTAYNTGNKPGGSDAFLLRFSLEGVAIWQASMTGTSAGDVGNAVAMDAAGNAYWVGGFNGCCPSQGGATLTGGDGTVRALTTPSYGSAFLAKLSPAGTPLWTATAYNRDTDFSRVAVDNSGAVYVSGYTRSWSAGTPTTVVNANGTTSQVPNPGLVSHFLLLFDANGMLQRSNPIYGTPSGNVDTDWADVWALAVVGSDIVVGGRYSAPTITFANTGGTSTQLTNEAAYDGFVACYSADGVVKWATRIGGAGDQSVVTLNSAGTYVWAGGGTTGDIHMGGIDLIARGVSDAFVMQLGGAGQPVSGSLLGGAQADSLVSLQAKGTDLALVAGNEGGGFEGLGASITAAGPYVLLPCAGSAPLLAPPYIVRQPTNLVMVAGSVAVFNVGAGGSEPLAYQWFFNRTNPVSWGIGPFLVLTNVQTDIAGSYSVRVTNAAGSVVSAEATLTVLTPPYIVRQPTNQIVAAGSAAAFSVVAGGDEPLAYQWFFNRTNLLPGAAAPTLTLFNVQAGLAGAYSVRVTNTVGSVFSAEAVLALPEIACSYALSAASTNIPAAAFVGGFQVSAGAGCAWAASSAQDWIHTASTWDGNGTVFYTVAANDTTNARTGTIVVEHQSFTITQQAAEEDFVARKANYNGLFLDQAGVGQSSSGFFKLTTTAAGKFTGSLQIGGTRYAFHGELDARGHGEAVTVRRNLPDLRVEFQIDPSGEGDTLTGTVADGTWVADLAADRAVFDGRELVCPQAGRYTLVLEGVASSASSPAGFSYGMVTVDKAGKIRVQGTLADNTSINQASVLSKKGQWPLYVPLYRGEGSVISWLTVSNQGPVAIGGDVVWIKPATASAKYYSEGFTIQTTASGSAYERPAQGASLLNWTDGQIVFSGGNLAEDLVNRFQLGPNSRVNGLGPNPMTLTFTATGGAFKGWVVDPATSKKLNYSGVVLQGSSLGFGFLQGDDQCGPVWITPAQQ